MRTGSLTYGVEIRSDDCYLHTVDAAHNFTQHLVDLLLCGADGTIP